jgi:hypothetical protein
MVQLSLFTDFENFSVFKPEVLIDWILDAYASAHFLQAFFIAYL